MRILILIAFMVCAAHANPIPDREDIDLVKIPLDGDKELDILTLANNADGTMSERTKRTIGILRELFPTISQIIDQKIQMIAAYLFRTIGPILLRSGLGGAGGGGQTNTRTNVDDDDDFGSDEDDDDASNDDSRKVSISLPTFPPDSDNDDDDNEEKEDKKENELRKRSLVKPDSKEPTKFDLLSGLTDDTNYSSIESTTNSEESNSNLVR